MNMDNVQRALPFALVLAIAGCAKEQPFSRTGYQYESKVHSGHVMVSEFTKRDELCPAGWREEEQITPTGAQKMGGFNLKVTVQAAKPGEPEQTLLAEMQSDEGTKVTIKDFQKDKNLLLEPQEDGLVKVGELFSYPDGFVIRSARPLIKENQISFCLGVDRMYIPEPANQIDGTPQISLDRLNVRYSSTRNEPITYQFGSAEPITVSVQVVPK